MDSPDPIYSTTLEEPVAITSVTAPDYRVERAVAVHALHTVATDLLRDGDAATTRSEVAHWLHQRAHILTHGH
ncbi:hypothetical protein [Bounagaea algeriensis]